jgi:hypothetical protein
MAGIQFTQTNKADLTNMSCTLQQGAAFYFDFKPLDGSGNPLDITNYTFDGSFKSAFDDSTKSHYDGRTVLTFDATAGNVVNDTTNSRFIVLFLATATEAIKFKSDTLEGVYDFYLSAPDGTRVRALWGDWTLTREVTAQ